MFEARPLTGAGGINTLFRIVRIIRPRYPFHRAPPGEVAWAMEDWHAASADPRRPTLADLEAALTEFWTRYDPDRDPLARALAAASSMRVDAVEVAFPDSLQSPLRVFTCMLIALHHAAAPGQPFYVARHPFAEALGVDKRTVGRWLARLVAMGWLEVVEPGSRKRKPHPDAAAADDTRDGPLATTYRWIGPGIAPPQTS